MSLRERSIGCNWGSLPTTRTAVIPDDHSDTTHLDITHNAFIGVKKALTPPNPSFDPFRAALVDTVGFGRAPIGALFTASLKNNVQEGQGRGTPTWAARVSQNKGLERGEDVIDTPETSGTFGSSRSSVACDQGHSPAKKAKSEIQWSCCVVCDGHGGQEMANYVASSLREILFAELNGLSTHDDTAVEGAIEKACEVCVTNGGSRGAGTTLLMMLHRVGTEQAWLVWMGDSKAVHFSPTDPECTYFTINHDIHNTSEKRRIDKLPGIHWDGNYLIDPINDKRVAPTRGFGDWSMTEESGYIRTPDIQKIKFTEGSYVLLATDGVWDVWDENVLAKAKAYEAKAKAADEGAAVEGTYPNIVEFLKAEIEKVNHTGAAVEGAVEGAAVEGAAVEGAAVEGAAVEGAVEGAVGGAAVEGAAFEGAAEGADEGAAASGAVVEGAAGKGAVEGAAEGAAVEGAAEVDLIDAVSSALWDETYSQWLKGYWMTGNKPAFELKSGYSADRFRSLAAEQIDDIGFVLWGNLGGM